MSEVVELTRNLVERESVSPEDAGCQAEIIDRLAGQGFEVYDYSAGGVTNTLLLRRFSNDEDGPTLVFAGHTDVVPADDSHWQTDPFELVERDGVLFGRGVADMKGAVASKVVALESFLENHAESARGAIGLLLTSDEEDARIYGTKHACERMVADGIGVDMVVIGEATSRERFGDELFTNRRGSHHLARLAIRGVVGHVAKANFLNPISIAADLEERMRDYDWDIHVADSRQDPTTVVVTALESRSEAENKTPLLVEMRINWRNNLNTSPHDIQVQMEQLAREVYAEHLGFRLLKIGPHPDIDQNLEFEWKAGCDPYVSSPDARIVKATAMAIRDTLGVAPEVTSGGGASDGVFTSQILGADTLEFGVVGKTIHQDNESVPRADLERLPGVYEAIARKVLL